MMVQFTKHELRKLSSVCMERYYEAEEVVNNQDIPAIERICAKLEMEDMEKLSAKLTEVAESNAKRVEIK